MSKENRTVDIFLVEDNEGDIFLTKKVFENSPLDCSITVARDGEAAIDMLKVSPVKPHIILLDINLPKKDGKKVLDEIKCDPALSSIPVVVLTSSRAEKDILESYKLHANSYIVKPVTIGKFNDVAAVISNFWFGVASLPEKPPRIVE